MVEKDFQIKTSRTIKNLDNPVFKYDIQPWVFFTAAGLIFAGVIFTIGAGAAAERLFAGIKAWISDYTGWFLVLTMNVVLATCIGIMVSPLGKLRIGGPKAQPEFTYISWFAMLFSAGMGIGLVFYGVAEPMFHYVANPLSEPGTQESAKVAMELTFLHWGFHPWGIYALIGLGLAFFGFTSGLPLSFRGGHIPGVWCPASERGAGPPVRHPPERRGAGCTHRRHHRPGHLVRDARTGRRHQGAK